MNPENLARLQDKLKYLGFGENAPINHELEEQVFRGEKEFQLCTEALFEDCRMEAKLFFEKSDEKDVYYFKKYVALLQYTDGTKADKTHIFHIYKKWGFTFKEAFNLLEGRAVYKKLIGQKDEIEYWAWSQMNFNERTLYGNYKMTEYHESYGYDLEAVLETYPIVELQDDLLKKALVRSLQRGNIHPVHFIKGTKRDKMFIEASPKTKRINIYRQATRAAGGAEKFPKDEEPPETTLFPATTTEPLVVEEPDAAPPGSEDTGTPDTSPGRPPRRRTYK